MGAVCCYDYQSYVIMVPSDGRHGSQVYAGHYSDEKENAAMRLHNDELTTEMLNEYVDWSHDLNEHLTNWKDVNENVSVWKELDKLEWQDLDEQQDELSRLVKDHKMDESEKEYQIEKLITELTCTVNLCQGLKKVLPNSRSILLIVALINYTARNTNWKIKMDEKTNKYVPEKQNEWAKLLLQQGEETAEFLKFAFTVWDDGGKFVYSGEDMQAFERNFQDEFARLVHSHKKLIDTIKVTGNFLDDRAQFDTHLRRYPLKMSDSFARLLMDIQIDLDHFLALTMILDHSRETFDLHIATFRKELNHWGIRLCIPYLYEGKFEPTSITFEKQVEWFEAHDKQRKASKVSLNDYFSQEVK